MIALKNTHPFFKAEMKVYQEETTRLRFMLERTLADKANMNIR